MTTLLSLNGIARSPDGLHPLLVALLERQRSLAIEPKVVALAACRGDRMAQAGPFPGTGRRSLEPVVPARKRRPARRIALTGEILPYSDDRLKGSPDGEYHWCSAGGSDSGRTICLFVPPQGY